MSGKYSKAWAKLRRSWRNPVKPTEQKELAKQTGQRKLVSTPRRLWTMECNVGPMTFGTYTNSKRSSLARLSFHKNLHCPIVLI
jgi:hypothetical protein